MGRGGGHPTPSDHLQSNRAVHKRKTYQTILESVVDKKKILDAVWSFTKKSPPRYVYVPTTQETSRIIIASLERCRLRGLRVHQLSNRRDKSAQAQQDPNKIAHYATPVGYHLPEGVVAEVCDDLGYAWDIHQHELRLQSGSGGIPLDMQNHEATREEITAAIHHHVPKIPAEDVEKIINHAFKKDSNRVGSAGNLSLIDRVNLAVQAHIRHTYTDYDSLLKQKEYKEARHEAEPGIISVLKKWRNLDDNGELEEGFREVVVLDDDDLPSKSEKALQDPRGLEQSAVAPRMARHVDDMDTDIAGSGYAIPRGQPFAQPIHLIRPSRSLHPDQREIRYEPVLRTVADQQPNAAAPKLSARPATQQAFLADGVLYNLEPVQPTHLNSRPAPRASQSVAYFEPDVHRPQLALESSRTQRPADASYQPPSVQVKASRYVTPHRPTPPIVSKRLSEQDIALPSVEREPESPYVLRSPENRLNHVARPMIRRYNPEEVDDLASSPRQSGAGNGSRNDLVRVITHPYQHEVHRVYAAVPPRASRTGDLGTYYEEPPREMRPAHIPEPSRIVYGYPPAVPRLPPAEPREHYIRSYPPIVEPGYVRSGQQRY